MTIETIGIVLDKTQMHIDALDGNGRLSEPRSGNRTGLVRYVSKLPACRVAMEPCPSAQFVRRKVEAMGHDTRFLPSQYGRAYVKGQKNDYTDAKEIAEAAVGSTMCDLPVKAIKQPELQILHRWRRQLLFVLEDADNGVPGRARTLDYELWQDLTRLEERIVWVTKELERMTAQDARTRACAPSAPAPPTQKVGYP